MRLLRCVPVLFLWCWLTPAGGGVALAAPDAPAPACSSDPTCTQLEGRARELAGMGLLDEAQRTYAAAFELKGDPKLLYERGRLLHKLGRFAEAAAAYKKSLETDPAMSDKQRRKIEQYLEQAQAEARETPAAPSPPSPSPSPPVRPEPVLVPGPEPLTARPEPVSPKPEPAPTPTPPPETAPPAPAPAAPAPVALRKPAPPPKKPTPIWKRWWLWTAVGVGVAGLAVGVGLGVASRRPDVDGATDYRPFGLGLRFGN